MARPLQALAIPQVRLFGNDPNVSVVNRIVMVLQIQRTWLWRNLFHASGGGCVREFLVLVHNNSVESDRDLGWLSELAPIVKFCAAEVDVIGLPCQWW